MVWEEWAALETAQGQRFGFADQSHAHTHAHACMVQFAPGCIRRLDDLQQAATAARRAQDDLRREVADGLAEAQRSRAAAAEDAAALRGRCEGLGRDAEAVRQEVRLAAGDVAAMRLQWRTDIGHRIWGGRTCFSFNQPRLFAEPQLLKKWPWGFTEQLYRIRLAEKLDKMIALKACTYH